MPFDALPCPSVPVRARPESGLSDARLFRSFDDKIIGGVLPLTLFCGGHNYFASRLPQRRGLEPYSVHTTFQYGGADGKRHRLREATMWEDDPSYYDPPGQTSHQSTDFAL